MYKAVRDFASSNGSFEYISVGKNYGKLNLVKK